MTPRITPYGRPLGPERGTRKMGRGRARDVVGEDDVRGVRHGDLDSVHGEPVEARHDVGHLARVRLRREGDEDLAVAFLARDRERRERASADRDA